MLVGRSSKAKGLQCCHYGLKLFFFYVSNKICIIFSQLFRSYEQAQDEVEKLRQELYPNLFAPQSTDGEGASNLQTIAEDANELTDTNNEYTEDTSEAYASDDDIPVQFNDDLDMDNDDDGELKSDRDDDVCLHDQFFVIPGNLALTFNFIYNRKHRRPPPNKTRIYSMHLVNANAPKMMSNSSRHLRKCSPIAIKSGCVTRSKPVPKTL